MRSSSEWKAITASRPARCQQRHDARQRLGHLRQLPVHENPKSLERPRGRILTPITPRARADGFAHDLRELPRAFDGPVRARCRNCSCNRLSKPFFTIVADNLRQFAHRRAGYKFRGGLAARRVHPHVERTVVPKREAARCVVDLRRGDSEIEQNSVDLRERKSTDDVGQFRKPRAAENETGLAYGECKSGGLGRRIAVDAHEVAGGAEARENGPRMAAAAERRVDVGAVRPDRQRRHGFFEQDGDMDIVGHQREKPSSSGGRPPAGNAIACAVSTCHCASSQSSNFWPWPTSTTCLSRLA